MRSTGVVESGSLIAEHYVRLARRHRRQDLLRDVLGRLQLEGNVRRRADGSRDSPATSDCEKSVRVSEGSRFDTTTPVPSSSRHAVAESCSRAALVAA